MHRESRTCSSSTFRPLGSHDDVVGCLINVTHSGLGQGQRKVLTKALTANGGAVLDFSSSASGNGGGSASPSSIVPNASQLLMKAAKTTGKQQSRAKQGVGKLEGGSESSSVGKKVQERL